MLITITTGEPACYAFQVAEYAKHFTCLSVDLRGTGESDKPEGVYSSELFADDVAAFMQAVGIPRAHVSGLSLSAAVKKDIELISAHQTIGMKASDGEIWAI